MGLIKFKRGSKVNLPTLFEGEPAFTTDTDEFFIGSSTGNVQLPTQTYVDTELGKKAKQSDLNATNILVNEKASQIDLNITNENVNTLTSSLAEKAQQTDLNTTNNNVGLKADKTYVDGKFGSMGNTKTFKGSCTFATLPASGMTVDDYWYVTDKTTNYCWNGTSWVDIGNNLKIADKSITPKKTSYIYPSPQNIYDYTTNEDGIRFGSTGAEVSDATYSSSDYIDVNDGTYVIGFPDSTETVKLSRVPFYDTNHVFASILSSGSTFATGRTIEVIVPSDGFIKVSPTVEDKHLLVVAKKDDFDGFHEFGWVQDVKAQPQINSVGKDQLIDKSVSIEKTDFVTTGKNFFNKDDVTLNTFYSSAPNTTALDGYYTLENPITLEPSTSYTIQKVRQYYVLDSSGVTVEGINTNDNNADVTITTPNKKTMLYMSGLISNLDVTQVEEGSTATPYEPWGIKINNLILSEGSATDVTDTKNTKLTVVKAGTIYKIRSNFDDLKDIIIETDAAGSNNGSFNFRQTELVDRGLNTNLEIIHSNGDDITPIRTFTTVGANHGYPNIVIVTMLGHDKTTADLGSQWTDGTTTYTLLDVSGNDLTFGCPYTVVNGIVSSIYVAPVTNLTHVSGANHTTAVNVATLVASPQLHPSINNISVKYLLDGVEITADGTYYGDELQVQEIYNVMDYKAIIDYAQANIGQSYKNDSIAGAVRFSINYVFGDKGSLVINHNFRALQKLSISNCGFIQDFPLSLTGYKVYRYLPNVLPKSGVDFKIPIDMSTYTQSLVFGTSDYIDPSIPPNRNIDWLKDSSTGAKKVGFAFGYFVDKSNAKNSDRLANTPNGWDMRNTTKSYPIAMSGLTLNPGDYKNFICYRNYLSPNWKSNATDFYIVKDKKDTYLYIDYHTTVSFENIKLDDYIGKSITVVDKSTDFTLHNDIVDADGVIFSVANNYGYAILKLT